MVAHSKVEADNAVADRRSHTWKPQSLNVHKSNLLLSDTHFRTFRSHADFNLITKTSSMLDMCGFYWGPMKDSRQKNCFFAISVKTARETVSIRISYQAGKFSLDGSKESFNCLFQLVEHYMASPKKMLLFPLRKVRLRPLQELCRKSILKLLEDKI
ncbi:hypothetical protein GDO86_017255 [Hymenochirus boettgeri]|uniref:SOCS box domain-containing protein n=1 Tax=Hymenochirus boettgeri TaxID=247094 RepID=A0A8T2IJH7_9PIPI|nr:hypothetical protein GDO86_017255 [Hymenochirus boettgeri]